MQIDIGRQISKYAIEPDMVVYKLYNQILIVALHHYILMNWQIQLFNI